MRLSSHPKIATAPIQLDVEGFLSTETSSQELIILLHEFRDHYKSMVVTNGSQEAIFLLAQLPIKPGDIVAVEELPYPPAMEALQLAGATLLPIPI